jgi:hypothetical protein
MLSSRILVGFASGHFPRGTSISIACGREMHRVLARNLWDAIPRRTIEDNMKIDLRETGCENSTTPGSYPVMGFGISGVERWGSATTVLWR